MGKKNDTENMPILLEKSMLLSHWQDAVWCGSSPYLRRGGKVVISETSNEDK